MLLPNRRPYIHQANDVPPPRNARFRSWRQVLARTRVKDGKITYGYNAATGVCDDMLDIGMLDPTRVTRLALTTEVVVAEAPTDDEHKHPMPDMGGMGDMGLHFARIFRLSWRAPLMRGFSFGVFAWTRWCCARLYDYRYCAGRMSSLKTFHRERQDGLGNSTARQITGFDRGRVKTTASTALAIDHRANSDSGRQLPGCSGSSSPAGAWDASSTRAENGIQLVTMATPLTL